MNNIDFLLHQTHITKLLNIVESNYLCAGRIIFSKFGSNFKEIYTMIHFDNSKYSIKYGRVGLMIHKNILLNRADYYIKSNGMDDFDFKRKKSLEEYITELYNLSDNEDNEVIFQDKIDLRKYLIGIIFMTANNDDDYISNNYEKIFDKQLDCTMYEKEIKTIFNKLDILKIPYYFVDI